MYTHIIVLHLVLVVYIQYGATALYLAAQEGRVNIVRLLIEAKAQINIQRTVCTRERERERGGGGGGGGGNYVSILPTCILMGV